MASMSSSDDLAKPLDEARNTKVEDKLPLLFLDEFDASPSNFGLLLPLLWDGAVTMRHTDLRLGKIIIVLAGSSQTIPDALGHAKSMRTTIQLPQGTNPKLIDLFSRINGSVVRIPLFYDPSHSVDRRTDKVLVAIQLLRLRFGSSLRLVSLALLRLIAKLTFRYDVRSIAHLINELPNALGEIDALTWKESRLPMSTPDELRNSSLVYHLVDDENNAHGVVDIWSKVGECSDMVPMPFPVPRIQEGDAGARMAVASMIAQVEAIISSVNAVPAGKENDV